MKPLPHDVCDRVAKYVSDGDLLLGELRMYELSGCTLATTEVVRILNLLGAIETKVKDMSE